MEALLDRLLRHDPHPKHTPDVASWWTSHKRRGGATRPIDDATYGGFTADRVAFAFAAGYHAALRALVPSLASDHLTALCATEEGGVHPKAIKATIARHDDGWVLSGRKRWATLADVASSLLVVASIGEDDGKNRLRVVWVPRDRAGVTLTMMDETPFAPEVRHAELQLENVLVADEEILPGDGFDRYLRPFRTVEDLHVHGALLGHVIAIARRHGFPHDAIESLIASIVAVRGLADVNPSRPVVHVAVAGVVADAKAALDSCERYFDRVDPETRRRWERDRPLFQVAERVRGERRAAAWRVLEGGSEDDGGRVSSETATTKR